MSLPDSKVRKFSLLAFALVVASAVQAQTTGVITGIVSDPSGSSIPGAQVAVHNTGTGETRILQTNGSGLYAAYALPVGKYNVEVSAPGFKKAKKTDIQLNVADQLAINFALEVGNVSETVEVTGATPTVDTETADISQTISTRQMTDLAVNGREFTSLQQLLPGASRTMGDEGGTGFNSSRGFAINGQREVSTGFQIDGVENTDMGNGTGLLTSPGMETIGEFKMNTSNYSAEYGNSGGANLLVVTRTGTKDFHGAAYDYFRNDALDARYFFANNTPTLRYNNFGYRIGGPVFIPHFYNRSRDKTFFFFAQEWRKRRTQDTFLAATPTPAMRSGDFSAEAARIGQPIIDPTTGLAFQNNQIPASRLNPNALLLLQNNFPQPNQSGFLNFNQNAPDSDNWRQETINVTHQLTNNTQVQVRYIEDTEIQNMSGVLWSSQSFPNIGTTINLPGHSFLAKATTSINASLLNEVSYDYASNYGSKSSGAISLNGAYTAPQGLNIQPLFPRPGGSPNKVPNLYFSGGWGEVDTSYYPWWAHHDIQSVTDNLSKVVGVHSFKFGGTYQHSVTPVESQVDPGYQGGFTFSGVFTNDPIADFLLGDAASYSQLSNTITPTYIYNQLELYAQDTWKVSPKLTLNLGVRYFYIPHTYEQNNILYNFLPTAYNPAQAVTVLPNGTIQPNSGNLLNGIVGVKNGLPTDLVKNYPWKFGPRLGFAYDPTGQGKWAIRGGYGIGYYRVQGNDTYSMVGNPPNASVVSVFNPSINNPNTAQPGAPQPISLNSLAEDYRVPMIQTFSFDVQRELMPGTLLDVGYVGTRGTHLERAINLNQPFPEGGYDFNPGLNTNTIPAALISPYLGFATINQKENTASSTYHSLQVQLKRQMSKGLLLQAVYTWSKAIADASAYAQLPQDSYDLRAERSLASFDRPHVFVLNYVYDLPFFRQQKGFLGEAFGGWELSGIVTLQSGTPINIGLTGGNIGLATRPNVVGGQTANGPKTVNEWFNTAAFTMPAYGFFGNSAEYSVRGPGVETWDFSLFKKFQIGERLSYQLRGDAFNLFNHTNFETVSSNLGAGNFGQVTAAHDPRILQVSMKLEF
ncbi:MAG TPA: carboxypeptidase regulatory-like domain-containing protein [Bryobacteraceae bacterium]|nr:carboxypeptidase regulatory-like domain-containing protein [Bryobacteraceae bacterium]